MGLCCNREAKNEPKYSTNISKKAKDKIDKFFKIIQKIQKEGGGKGKVYISEKKFEKFLKYMEVYENQEYFLLKLNNYRVVTKNISEEAFNYIEKIFSFIVNYLTGKNINNENFGVFRSVIILSQTFVYKITENEKIFLQDKLKVKQIFGGIEFWKKYSGYLINQEVDKLIKNEETNQEGEKLDKLRERGAFSQLLDVIKNMKDFGFPKNQIKETIAQYFDQYKISQENQLTLNSYVDLEE